MEDRTQMMGDAQPSGATILGGASGYEGFDSGRTQMAGTDRTLDVQCLSGNRYALAGETSRDHALVLLKANDRQLGRRAPLNVSLVLDRSGSMEGAPLEYAKRACDYVVDMLEPNDILSIITFEEQVEVLMPARRVVNKALVKEHIHRIEVGNTTNLYDGLMAGCAQVTSVSQQTAGYVNRVLLLTDGEPTAGLRDFSSIVQQVAEQKARGVSVTALGFGDEYNEELMAGIARRSGGNYYYIQRPDLLQEVFRRELETMMTVVAKNVRLRLQLARWVQLRQVYGQQAPDQARSIEITMPDIERGSVRTALAELEFDRHPQGTFRVLKAEVTFDDVVYGRPDRVVGDGVFEFTHDRNLVVSNVDPVVKSELEIAQASQNLQKTMMGMRTQQLTAMGAMQELQRTRTILIQSGQSGQAREIDSALQSLERGGDVEKTLMGAIVQLDQGKRE